MKKTYTTPMGELTKLNLTEVKSFKSFWLSVQNNGCELDIEINKKQAVEIFRKSGCLVAYLIENNNSLYIC